MGLDRRCYSDSFFAAREQFKAFIVSGHVLRIYLIPQNLT